LDGLGLYRKAEISRLAYRPQNPHRVVPESQGRGGSNLALGQILLSV
jgi:hypothetical protein